MSNILPAAISCILRVLPSRVLSSLPLSLGAAFLCLAASSLPAQQAAMSIVAPATPTYVDAVTGVFTIPGQPTASGTVGYSVDGGAAATANLVNGNAYLNLGQFAKGQHVLKIETVGSPGAVVPPPVNFMATDQALTFVGTEGLLYPSGYTSRTSRPARGQRWSPAEQTAAGSRERERRLVDH